MTLTVAPTSRRGGRSHPRQDRTASGQGRALCRSGHSGAQPPDARPRHRHPGAARRAAALSRRPFRAPGRPGLAVAGRASMRRSAMSASCGSQRLAGIPGHPRRRPCRDSLGAAHASVFTRRSRAWPKSMGLSDTGRAGLAQPRQPASRSRQCLAMGAFDLVALRAQ